MKNFKLVLILVISFFPVCLGAKQVSPETAQKVAETQILSRNQLRSAQELNLVFVKTTDNKTISAQAKVNSNTPADVLYYVFNVGEKGFVIVSGDDVAVPVLGYSDAGAYDSDNLSPNFVYFLDDFLAKEIEQAISQNIPQNEKTKEQWQAYLSGEAVALRVATATTPLLDEKGIKWNQRLPYNYYCPQYNGGRTVTGCVATAMAQIMMFYEYPRFGNGTIGGYNTTTLGISIAQMDISTHEYKWENMLAQYPERWGGTQAEDEVAKLMYDCGVSVNMDYYPSGSGAVMRNSGTAFINNFGYSQSITYKQRAYYTIDEWETLLKAEINKRQPVLYGGQAPDGGHAFVCDGYDDSGKFHFNWGWGGTDNNNYFVLNALNTSSGNFNSGQEIIINISPNNSSEINYEMILGAGANNPMVFTSTAVNNQVNSTELFGVSTAFYFNVGYFPITGYMGVAFYDKTNQLLQVLAQSSSSQDFLPWGTGYGLSYSNLRVSSSVPPGDYFIKPILRTTANDIIIVRTSIQLPLTIKGVTLDETNLDIVVGDNIQLTPTIFISPTPTNVTWSSSNQNVAEVNGNGLVTGKAQGTATITVAVVDGTSTYTATCNINVSNLPSTTIAWTGAAGDNKWDNPANWDNGIPDITDKVIIPASVSNFPILTNNVTVAEIHFEPGAQIGNQSKLTGKAFVQYNLGKRERWNMLSIPLEQVYPGDFAFGGYPQTWVRTFTTTSDGNITKGSWVTARASTNAFSAGDGFVLWLNADDHSGEPVNNEKGLKLLDNNIRELPFFQHHIEGSPDYDTYHAVHQAHFYVGVEEEGVSTFYNVVNDNGQYVLGSNHYDVNRDESAYKLAGASGSIALNFADGSFAVVGNPYMATLDFSELYDTNQSQIKPNYYIWTGEDYTIFAPDGISGAEISDNPQWQYIAPLQGFIVEKVETRAAAASPQLSFNENMTSVNKAVVLRSSENKNKLDIVARNKVAGVRTFIAKREYGQDEFGDFDARKIINSISDIPEIYTLKPYKSGIIATGINIINNDDLLIPVGLATSYEGNITLSFSGMDAYDAELYLIDAEINKEIELTGLASYDYVFDYTPKTVNGETAVCENRFFIRISKTVTGLRETIAKKANVFETNGLICVVSGASNPIKEVAVYNLQGALMYKKSAINAISYMVSRNWPAGAYIVKVVSEKNIDNIKLIIK